MPPDEAKGYGLWVAKVVAARKFGRTREKRFAITSAGAGSRPRAVDFDLARRGG